MQRKAAAILCLSLVLALFGFPAQAATGSISGLITGASGQPVPGAMIEVLQYDVGVVGVARTGADGRYTVPIATGFGNNTRIRASAPGLATTTSGWRDPNPTAVADIKLGIGYTTISGTATDKVTGSPVPGARVDLFRYGYGIFHTVYTNASGHFTFYQVPPAGNNYLIVAAATGYNQYLSGWQVEGAVVEVKLNPAGGTLAGVVVNSATGSPVTRALVEVFRYGVGVVATASTGEDGGFRFSPLLSVGNNYQVRAYHDGYRPTSTGWVEVGNGQTVSLSSDRAMKLAPRYGRIVGVVTNGGKPVVGARVDLSRYGVGQIATTATGADGSYAFENVLADIGNNYLVEVVGGGGGGFNSGWADVAPGKTAQADKVVGSRSTAASGSAIITGRVTNTANEGVAGAVVRVIRLGGSVFTAQADGSGRYTLSVPANRWGTSTPSDPAPGGYVVEAEAVGYYASRMPPDSAGNRGSLDFDAGATATVNIGLHKNTTTVQGKVTDDQSKPVAGARVTLGLPGFSAPQATTGADGAYAITGVPTFQRSPYMATASKEGYFASSIPPGSPGSRDFLDAGDGVINADITLHATTGAVAGTITDTADSPLAGATVYLRRSDTGQLLTATADGSGNFSIAGATTYSNDNLWLWAEAEGYTPSVSAPGSPGVAAAFALSGGQQLSRSLQMKKDTGTIQGKVTAGGKPVSGATVYLFWSGYGNISGVTTDANGDYRLERVPVDFNSAYWVRVVASGLVPGDILAGGVGSMDPIAIAPAQIKTLNIELRAPGRFPYADYDTAPPSLSYTPSRLEEGLRIGVAGQASDNAGAVDTAWIAGQAVRASGGQFGGGVTWGPGEGRVNVPVWAQDAQGNLSAAVAWLNVQHPTGGGSVGGGATSGAGGGTTGGTVGSATPRPPRPPPPPPEPGPHPFVTATPGDAKVVLTWTASTEPDVSGYYVYRGTSPGTYDQMPLTDFPLQVLTFTDTNVVNGTTYYYKVVVVYQNLTEGPASEEVSATPQARQVTTIRLVIGDRTALVNGQARMLDVAPLIMKNRTMVPLRFIGEALGAEVGYVAAERKVSYNLAGREVFLWIDQTRALVKGQETTLDVAPTIVEGRTLVPVRFVSTALGAKILFNPDDQSITVTYPE